MAEMFASQPGGSLERVLLADDIKPGSELSYDIAKDIFSYHPLGAKLAEKPILMATSQKRNIVIDGAPGDDVIEAFNNARDELELDNRVYRLGVQSKIYGISALFVGTLESPLNIPITADIIRNEGIYVNVLDSLNTAGSLVLNQDPLAPDYLKPKDLNIKGTLINRSRAVVLINELPLYLEWSDSAFGFSGRSVYQRVLFSLKSYIEAMLSADMLAKKCGVIVAKTKEQGSVANNLAARALNRKREYTKMAKTGNVISINTEESIESLDLTNTASALDTSINRIIETIAAGSGMPAILLKEEALAQGFGEGSEDAKQIAGFIDGIRKWLNPAFEYTDKIAMAHAWTPEFYETIQSRYPEYENIPYDTAVNDWKRQFKAIWPEYIKETDSEKGERARNDLQALTQVLTSVSPLLDPDNKASLINWYQDALNSMPDLIKAQLMLDPDTLLEHLQNNTPINPTNNINEGE